MANKLPTGRNSFAGGADAQPVQPAAVRRTSEFSDAGSVAGSVAETSFQGRLAAERETGSIDARASLERLQRVESLIFREVGALKRSGAEALSVVIRPDPHTEVLVSLTHRGGHVEAALRFERGDVAALAQHWSQLREALAQHEVRLLPLAEASAQAAIQSGANGSSSNSFAGDGWQTAGQKTPFFDERGGARQDASTPDSQGQSQSHSHSHSRRGEPAIEDAPRIHRPAGGVPKRDRWETWA